MAAERHPRRGRLPPCFSPAAYSRAPGAEQRLSAGPSHGLLLEPCSVCGLPVVISAVCFQAQ